MTTLLWPTTHFGTKDIHQMEHTKSCGSKIFVLLLFREI